MPDNEIEQIQDVEDFDDSPDAYDIIPELNDNLNLLSEEDDNTDDSQDNENIDLNNGQGSKIKANPSQWLDNVAKKTRNLGLPGYGRKNKPIFEKRMKRRCNGCRKSCDEISDEVRKNMHKNFWNLGDHTRQWDALRLLYQSTSPKERKVEEDEFIKSRKTRTYIYTLEETDNKKYNVCKTMFFNTFGKQSHSLK